ncbi:ABC transporter substrate-binding protein [Clostridium formicaceticum]|uniref:Diguanylate phosphodiesterase n=1 Tax=Clostridium formicaceticum TaxID=1497 RepID=A0AAC9RGP0_9CLOT|nr:ABC transporter substrate-binding protein [Clostridium formicaceticum]AOY76222.1 diguanylate phosphodiesterase [Clostridium formicaceticum]ARE86601.1 Periplasmic dipeptide transport protein precursor [Clostridium formicaceticum]
MRTRDKKIKLGIIFIWIVMFLVTACSSSNLSAGEENQEVSVEVEEEKSDEIALIRLEGGDWGYPSPYLHYSRGPGGYKMQLVFDGLLERDEKGLIPWIAKEWEVSEDGLNYIFTIHEGIQWHDGEPLKLEDIQFSFEYLKKHPPVWNPVAIEGKPFVKDIEVLEDNKIKFTLAEENATILEKIGDVRIIPKHIWENVEDPEKFEDEKAVIGCGPYTLTGYSKEHGTYEFTAFEDYWGPKQRVEKIQFVPVSDGVLAFENNEIDLVGVGTDLLDRYQNDPEFKVSEAPGFWGYRLLFNMEKNPIFKEKEIRQAIAYGIDQEEMVAKVARGAAIPGSAGYLPEHHIWYNPKVRKYPFDEEKAKELLGDKKVSLQLLTANSNAEIRIAELMKISLNKIGIEVNIESVDSKARDHAVTTGDYEVVLTGHGGWGGDADGLRERYASEVRVSGSPSANIIRGYENQQIKALAEEQLREMDTNKRKEIIFALQEVIAEEIPMIPIYNTTGYSVYRPATYDGWMYMYDHHSLEHSKLSYLTRK